MADPQIMDHQSPQVFISCGRVEPHLVPFVSWLPDAASISVRKCEMLPDAEYHIHCQLAVLPRLLPMAIYNLLDVLRCVDPLEEAVGVVDYPRPVRKPSGGWGKAMSSGRILEVRSKRVPLIGFIGVYRIPGHFSSKKFVQLANSMGK